MGDTPQWASDKKTPPPPPPKQQPVERPSREPMRKNEDRPGREQANTEKKIDRTPADWIKPKGK